MPLWSTPTEDPVSWAAATAHGLHGVAVVGSACSLRDIGLLHAAGLEVLGYLSLGYATRRVADILTEVTEWARRPVTGIFFDHAPSGPYQIGPVVQAVRAARRYGLATAVLNPGVPVDPIYRRLDALMCTFEGDWDDYRSRTTADLRPGDGHLVLGVPQEDWDAAFALTSARGAALRLVTDRATTWPTSFAPDADSIGAANH